MSIKQEDLYKYMSNQDVQLPEDLIPIPVVQEPEVVREVKDNFDVAFNFAFVGAGQGEVELLSLLQLGV